MAKNPLVLAVDHEARIRHVIRLELEGQGFRVIEAENGSSALSRAESEKPDAIVLDIRMPDMSGLDVMKQIRTESSAPIIILTGRDRDADKILGLESGADDYLVKPFNPEELTARLRAVLRRYEAAGAAVRNLTIDDVEIDLHRRLVKKRGSVVALTRTEWMLLRRLAESPGKTMLNGELLTQVWGPEFKEDLKYLRVWVSRVRSKLETNPSKPTIIKTIEGVGYRLAPREPEPEQPLV